MNKKLLLLLLALLVGSLAVFSGAGCKKPEVEPSYINSTYGFSINFPEDWLEQETGEKVPIVIIYDSTMSSMVGVSLQYLSESKTLDEVASEIIAEMEQTDGIETVSFSETMVGGEPGYEIVIKQQAQNVSYKIKNILLLRGTQLFLIQAYGTSANYDLKQDTLDQIVYSFRLEEPKPFGITKDGTLTLFDIGPVTLDPAVARESSSTRFIAQIFSGLVSYDQEMTLVPELAQDWDISADGTVYTFYLRRGAKFHDGREVKADDFKYSLERTCDPETGSQTAETYLGDIVGVKAVLEGQATEISGVRVIDDYILEITIYGPKAYFLAKLTYQTAYVVDQANVESGPEWWRQPNGTGPFQLEEWQEDEILILERNSLYYGEPSHLEHVVFRLWGGVPMMMYETGEIDIATVYLNDLERVLDPTNPLHEELVIAPEFSLYYIGFDVTRPPFDDVGIRQAFCHAIDKDKLIGLVLKDSVSRADGILPPGMPGYNEDLQGLSYDVPRARELITQSKYGDVSSLPAITFTTAGYGGGISDLLEAVIDMWRQNLGVKVGVRQLEPETYIYQLKEEKDELFDSGWGADYPDPQNFLGVLFRSGGDNNFGDYGNPEVDVLLDQAATETDSAVRLGLYQQAEQIIVNDAAVIPLYSSMNYVLVKPYVRGYVLTPLNIPILKNVWIEPH